MKVILKGGSEEKNKEIEKFFMENIFPILDFGIAIEPSDSIITVHEKKKDGEVKTYVDPTAEVIVELSAKEIVLAKVCHSVYEENNEFADEARAILEIERLQRSFSVEYYSCRYSPPEEVEELTEEE